jgi:DNA polymerase III subunit epsilon
MKSKTTAAFLALFLGHIGVHRFYLGQTLYGVLYLLFCWTFIPSTIAIIDFILFITMSHKKFNLKYNINNQTSNIESFGGKGEDGVYLFFDTETTGLPKNWKAPVSDLDNWPRMIQIAWILCDSGGNKIETEVHIIKPDGFIIPKGASDIHGITTEKANKEGVPLIEVLNKFNAAVSKSDFIIAHNISFDEKIMGAELLRLDVRGDFQSTTKLCTMKSSTDYCKIPGNYGYKWPTLSELHIKLFGEDFEDAHDALVDISITEKCFWALRRKGII